MPGTASEKIFSFNAREVKEGQLAGKIPAADGTMSVKYVMSYYICHIVGTLCCLLVLPMLVHKIW